MIRLTMFTVALLCLPSALVAQANATSPEAAVRRADSLWANSYAVHDTARARQLFDPQFVMTSTDGSRKDRERELMDVRSSPQWTVNYFRSLDVTVRMLGESAAVVTGTLDWRLTSNGQPQDTRRRYTATWERGGPLGWRMVALHVGRAPQ